jgi:hypothetical protein
MYVCMYVCMYVWMDGVVLECFAFWIRATIIIKCDLDAISNLVFESELLLQSSICVFLLMLLLL